jgi:hypothetical protein
MAFEQDCANKIYASAVIELNQIKSRILEMVLASTHDTGGPTDLLVTIPLIRSCIGPPPPAVDVSALTMTFGAVHRFRDRFVDGPACRLS